MPKALIISYFFPPLSGPGVQRSYNIVRNLAENGWEPVVLTVKDICYVGRDETLIKKLAGIEIIRTETIDPMRILYLWEKIWGRSRDKSIYVQAGSGIRQFGRDIFPLDSKIGWLATAFRRACNICRTHDIKVIYATMSPYSSGILANKVSKAMNIPYILDYRDLWSGKPDLSYFSRWHRKLSEKWEQRIIEAAAAIIQVTEWSRTRFLELFPECNKEKVSVIFNGYDRESIPVKIPHVSSKGVIRFTYAGHFYGERNPGEFLGALAELIAENSLDESVEFEFIGNYPREIEELFFEHKCLKRVKYMNYDEYLEKLIDSSVLLLFISSRNSEMVLTQKLFEYLAVRRPIFAMIPEVGEAAEIIRKYNAGIIITGADRAGIKRGILEMCEIVRQGEVNARFQVSENDYSKFERQAQAKQLAKLMDTVTNG
ncbi:MAG: glycosyltransferase [Candidatus Cloacimonetes bacterium]|nr:glycosyltransferase [Candidatus Cloacimonadota bacterium]